jgi:hypothetical protein
LKEAKIILWQKKLLKVMIRPRKFIMINDLFFILFEDSFSYLQQKFDIWNLSAFFRKNKRESLNIIKFDCFNKIFSNFYLIQHQFGCKKYFHYSV